MYAPTMSKRQPASDALVAFVVRGILTVVGMLAIYFGVLDLL